MIASSQETSRQGSSIEALRERAGGRLAVDDVLEIACRLLPVVEAAHASGVLHRDIKPANLFRTVDPVGLKVLDFGISKVTARGSVSDFGYTKTQAVMGSPLYMSPEQMESTRNVDARTDIWALGVVLYELLTGNLPFLADSMPELVTRILKSPPVPMSTYRGELPLGLEAVIATCLQKDRQDRYPNVAKLAHALLPYGPKRLPSHWTPNSVLSDCST